GGGGPAPCPGNASGARGGRRRSLGTEHRRVGARLELPVGGREDHPQVVAGVQGDRLAVVGVGHRQRAVLDDRLGGGRGRGGRRGGGGRRRALRRSRRLDRRLDRGGRR